MELAVITAKQVAELLLMILAGAVCCKAGVFKPKEKSVLANLLLYLVVPAMVLDSYMVEYDPTTFHNLMLAFSLGALVLLVGLAAAFAATIKVQKDVRAILWFACAFSNAGYMGFPLIKALFGSEGLLYASGFVTVFNILIWTIGYVVVSGQVNPKQTVRAVATCPCIIAVVVGLFLYLARIPPAGDPYRPHRCYRRYEHTAVHDHHRRDDRIQRPEKAAEK